MQIADNIASQGNKVIIFSLEQSRFELVTKSISRITYLRSPGNARLTNFIMENENIDQITMDALTEYTNKIAENEIIEEGNFNMDINSIRDYTKEYIATTGNRPVIVIDYLQAIAPSSDKFTDKQQIDYNVREIKRLSRDYEIPIICISSFNRQNYYESVTFEAFKESGGIEYTADVLLGLQLKILADMEPGGKNGGLNKSQKEEVQEAKRKIPREVQLVCLKNRGGKCNFGVNFDYNTAFHTFKEQQHQEQN